MHLYRRENIKKFLRKIFLNGRKDPCWTLTWDHLSSIFTAPALEFALSHLGCLQFWCLHLTWSQSGGGNWQAQGLQMWLHEKLCCQPATADTATPEYTHAQPDTTQPHQVWLCRVESHQKVMSPCANLHCTALCRIFPLEVLGSVSHISLLHSFYFLFLFNKNPYFATFCHQHKICKR